MQSETPRPTVADLQAEGVLLVEDGNHGEYRPRPDEFVSDGVAFIRAADMDGGRVLFEQAERINEAARARIRKGIGRPGDVLLSHKGTVGKVSLAPHDAPPFVCSPQTTFWRTLNANRLDRRYLYAYLRSPDFRAQLASRKGETDMADYVSLTAQRQLRVALPDITVQRGVGATVGALDTRIDLLRQTNATIESIAQTLFKSWFVDFDPVRAKAEGREPEGIDAATAALFPAKFEESTSGKIPKGWRIETLGDWLTVLETGKRPKGGVGGIDRGVPSIGAESITRVGIYDFSKTKYIPDDFFAQMRSGTLSSHDVLLYKDGGKPGIFLPRVSMFGDGFPFERCAINEHVFRLRVREPISQEYLYFWIWSDAVMHELRHRGGKAAIPGINQSDVREQRLLIPSAEISTRFKELVAPMFSKIFGNARTVETLEGLRNNLLPRLISGKCRLQEVEEMVEDALA